MNRDSAHTKIRRRRRTSVGVGLAWASWLTLVPGAGIAIGAAPEDNGGPRITDAVAVTDDEVAGPGRSFTSPSLVVDPDNPNLVYAATVDVRSQRCTFLRSADAGRTWTSADASPSPESHPYCTSTTGFIPMAFLEMGQNGTLYYLHNAWDLQDDGVDGDNRSVFLARSTDQGESWLSTPVRNNRGKQGNDIERSIANDLAVDTSGPTDVVYAGYGTSFPLPEEPSRPGHAMVAVSTDEGASFAEPVSVVGEFFENKANHAGPIPDGDDPGGYFGGSSPTMTVDDSGRLSVAWIGRTANITPSPPSGLYLSQSTDRGATFEVTEVQPGDKANTGTTGPMLRWSPAGGEAGSLHLVWEGKEPVTQGDRDILHRRSLDGGATWSDSTVVNDDDPALLFGQFHPNLRVAPNGRLDLVWWDQRDAAGAFGTDVYYAYSSDAGATWSPDQRMTDRLIDRTIGVWKPGTGGDVRQPPGVASGDALATVVWDDTRNGSTASQTQDLYASSAQFEPLATTGIPQGVGYVLAVVIGLGVVGVILVVGSKLMGLGRRSSDPPSTSAPAKHDAVTVG